jgi:transposase
VDTSQPEESVPVSKQQQKHTAEYRARAVRLAEESDKPLTQVARDLGVKYQTLYDWVSRARKLKARPEGAAPELTAEEEVRALRRQLEDVTEERDFLKKAAAYFAKVNK